MPVIKLKVPTPIDRERLPRKTFEVSAGKLRAIMKRSGGSNGSGGRSRKGSDKRAK